MDTTKESASEALMAAETAKLYAEIAKLNAELQLIRVKAVWNPILVVGLILIAAVASGLTVFGMVSR